LLSAKEIHFSEKGNDETVRNTSAIEFFLAATVVAMRASFLDTLGSSGLHYALLIMVAVGSIVLCTGIIGLSLFWRNKNG
jgi:hypothetical protein